MNNIAKLHRLKYGPAHVFGGKLALPYAEVYDIAFQADEEIQKLRELLDEVICTNAYGGPTLDLVQRINKALKDE